VISNSCLLHVVLLLAVLVVGLRIVISFVFVAELDNSKKLKY